VAHELNKSLLHVTGKQQLLLEVLWQFMAERSSSVKRELIPLHQLHRPTCVGLEMMLRDVVWFGKFPCFIVSCLTCNQHSSFSSSRTRTQQCPVLIWQHPDLGLVKDFWVKFVLSASAFGASTFIHLLLHTNILLDCNFFCPWQRSFI
jgi:hypothetical protein